VRLGVEPMLRSAEAPGRRASARVEIVSLFCGAGGLDLGFKNVGFKIGTAIDSSSAAVRTHRRNFARTRAVARDLVELGPGGIAKEVRGTMDPGSRIGVIGGPPCQGFSRANTSARVDDPRNQLPAVYLDAISRLQDDFVVEFVVFENVLGLRDRKHAALLEQLVRTMEELCFDVTRLELSALDFAVPQKRNRLVLVGMRSGVGYGPVSPRRRKGMSTVREAIGGLPDPVFFERGLGAEDIPFHPNHWTMQPRSPRFMNDDYSAVNGRSFKRLRWDEPSPTVAYGNREIHVHPTGRRRLSIYEAMLLQGFPHEFVLEGNLSEQVDQVSNAVPPPLARSIANAVALSVRGGINVGISAS